MKIGRNDPCPCGSGKKYKKCCLLKPQNTMVKNNDENISSSEPGSGSDERGTDFDELESASDAQEVLFKLLNNLRSFSLDMKPHIKTYKKIRKLHSEIINSMADYFDRGKFEQKVDPDYAHPVTPVHNKAGGIRDNTVVLLESNFNLNTREGNNGFYDMLIYKSVPNINCITEEFIQKHRYRKQEKIEFLESMLDSKMGLFEITEIDLKEGYAYLKEVFTGGEYKITDIGLSGSKDYDKFYIYTRIITYRNVSFGTGLNLTFTKTDSFIKNYIKREKKDYTPLAESRRFVELYNRFSEDQNGVKVITNEY